MKKLPQIIEYIRERTESKADAYVTTREIYEEFCESQYVTLRGITKHLSMYSKNDSRLEGKKIEVCGKLLWAWRFSQTKKG